MFYTLPATLIQDEITTIIYDNPNEPKISMQNLDADNCYLHIKATDANGVIYQIPFFKVTDYPQHQMKKLSDGRFKISMKLHSFLSIPDNVVIKKIDVTARKKNWVTVDDQSDKVITIKTGCQ